MKQRPRQQRLPNPNTLPLPKRPTVITNRMGETWVEMVGGYTMDDIYYYFCD